MKRLLIRLSLIVCMMMILPSVMSAETRDISLEEAMQYVRKALSDTDNNHRKYDYNLYLYKYESSGIMHKSQ